MKRLIGVLAFAALFLGTASSQEMKYRVVFDLTSKDTLDQRLALRWITETLSVHPEGEIEVVMYAKGIELVMPERSVYINAVREAMKRPNVTFRVCAIALKNSRVDVSEILGDAHTVPDGIYEIASKQHQGWSYIKVSH